MACRLETRQHVALWLAHVCHAFWELYRENALLKNFIPLVSSLLSVVARCP